jgi:hypothetical protein
MLIYATKVCLIANHNKKCTNFVSHNKNDIRNDLHPRTEIYLMYPGNNQINIRLNSHQLKTYLKYHILQYKHILHRNKGNDG